MRNDNYWQKFQRQRISRRRLLAAGGVGAAGLALVAACGGDDEPTADGTPEGTPGASGAPVRGGKWAFAITVDWGTIDPVTSVATGPQIFPRIYNTLVEQSRVNPEFLYADLAEAAPEQPDAQTFIYTIRQGVKIAPNALTIPERDLDANDAKVWLDRVQADETAVPRAMTNQYLDTYEASADGRTFTINLKSPYSYFLLRLGAALGGTIPPREFFEQNISLKDQGVGAGPFMIRPGTYQETGGIVLDRNPNYYRKDEATGEQLPYIDALEAFRISDRQARRTAFQSKQIHEYGAENAAEAAQLEQDIPGLQVFEEPSNQHISFTMHPEKAPWTDERIRRAAMLALDRQQFVDLIVGTENGKIDGLVHWQLGPFALPEDELATLQPYDPAGARELIRAVTGEDTITIKVMYPITDFQFHDQHLPIWRQQMEAAGFVLDVEPLDLTAWLTRYTQLQYDSSLSANRAYETAEIPLDFHAAHGPQGDDLYAVGLGKIDAEVEAAITASKQAGSSEEHIQRVLDAQRLIYQKGPAFLPIMSWTTFDLRHGFVKNYPPGIGESDWYVNDWWLEGQPS